MRPDPFQVTLGARVEGNGQTRFRVWAPHRRTVEVSLHEPGGTRFLPLAPTERGYFEGTHAVPVGARYKYRLDGDTCYPDPCSRFQPEGPHGPSQVVDPNRYVWKDAGWRGLPARGQVFYELHVGAFTPEGTYAGAAAKLPMLKDLGVTTVELMPLHTFPGRYNWGYDGTHLFAPCAVYGDPDDLRRLVDTAHGLGLGIILDVVYNHLGPNGNYLPQFSQGYFNTKYPNEWGDPTNFDDGEAAGPSRDFFIQNACLWIAEYHFDGLRLDATQSLYDASARHIVRDITEQARAAAKGRNIVITAESEPQDARMATPPEEGGHGANAVWVDDFHHSARVALTGRIESYFTDYRGGMQELLSCVLRNSLYQGQYYAWQEKRRGTPLRQLPADRVVFYIQNHDQIANALRGERLHFMAGHPRMRAFTTFFLLLPQTPMIFMGQEFFASSPFLYFVDHPPELQELVRKGRDEFLCQSPSARHALEVEGFRVPIDEEAFLRSKLDWSERERHQEALALHRELLRLRREDAAFAARPDGAVLGPQTLVLRWYGDEQAGDRLLVLNLGVRVRFEPCPDPLVAPPPGKIWRPLLSSEETRFGGMGSPAQPGDGRLDLPGQSALVLTSREETKA